MFPPTLPNSNNGCWLARAAPPAGSAIRSAAATATRRIPGAYPEGGRRSALPRTSGRLAAVRRDVRPGAVVARVGRVAGVCLDHHDLLRLARDRAARLRDRVGDEHAHVARDASDG